MKIIFSALWAESWAPDAHKLCLMIVRYPFRTIKN